MSSKGSKNVRKNEKKALESENGCRLIINRSPQVVAGGPNNRRCILDSLLALIGDPVIKEAVTSSFISLMPSKGDTPISVANKALAEHGMVLKRVTPRYYGGCIAFNLLRIQECRLIVSVMLWDLKRPSWFTSHCVAWDGKIIHERPKSAKINDTTDRQEENSKKVFERLFHDYHRWQITNVYELRPML